MQAKKGNISVHTQNLLPIIKKWLYSDKDIFVREMVSNGCDAISKFRKLTGVGEAKDDGSAPRIDVTLDAQARTLTFSDTGIGMTAEEVEKYITQIAFSGAQEFMEKYKGEDTGIIGHFGLGFYSAFMVAGRVEIRTRSWQEDAQPVIWSSDGGEEYEMREGERAARGTDIILTLAEEEDEFLEAHHLREVLDKYCAFLPYPIYLHEVGKEAEGQEDEAPPIEGEEAPEGEEGETLQGEEGDTPAEEKPINDTQPLWQKTPADCTEEEYKDFYRRVFRTYEEPLFWIHMHVDYPFNLKGILYFPRLRHEFDASQGQIKLYNNQVFIADNIKEVIPEFLLLLKGTLDCPDLPLNVSRSFLQNDGYVRKIQAHITRKVADKLVSLFENQREDYEKYWEDIHPFVKYGCLRDEKFYDRVKDALIYRIAGGEGCVTLETYLEKAKDTHENQVYYTTDEKRQAAYIDRLGEKDIDALVLNTGIDTHFISFVEMKQSGVKFLRVDAELAGALKDETDEELAKRVTEAFGKELEGVKIEAAALSVDAAGIILLGEQNRRMQEMSALYGDKGFAGMFPPEERTFVVNLNSPLVAGLPDMPEERRSLVAKQIYDLARLAHGPLEPQDMAAFLARTQELMG